MKNEMNFQKIEDFKKKIQINEKLGLDRKDNMILSLIQNKPNISQIEIGEKIKLSQPSVGARLRKLRDRGILCLNSGMNFKTVDLKLAKIDINASNIQAVLGEFKDCPFFINALITSGRYNLVLFFAATDLKRLEGIVNCHLRDNPKVKDIELNVVISVDRDLILPLNIDYENKNQINCEQKCADLI